MKNIIMLVLCWAGCMAALGQDLSFKDDFSRYADGLPPPEAWEVLSGSGNWLIQNKKLTAHAEGGLCQTRRVPELDAFDYVARLTINKRVTTNGWATAGITVSLDQHNHWRLNLVEAPDGKRYAEFGETVEGRWQAQNEGPTRLRGDRTDLRNGEWQYGREYLLHIKLTAQDICGEIAEADTGRTIARYRYLWDQAEGVKFGRPGLSANGLAITCAAVSVGAERTPSAGAAITVEPGTAGRVAMLKDIPGLDRAQNDALATAFRRAGFGVTFLNGQQLASPAVFSPMNFDYVVLAGSHFFPSKAKNNFLRFLRNGGHCVALGGDVFEEPVAQYNGRWYSHADVERELAATKPETILLDLAKGDTRIWRRSSDVAKAASAVVAQDQGLRFEIRGLKGWDTFNVAIPAFSKGQTLLCFRAKGDAATPQMAVEIDEKDGSRWVATVELKPDWNSYALSPDRFAPWEAKAISKKSSFAPANAARLSFGLASSFNSNLSKGDHTFWVDSFGTASNHLAKIDLRQKVELNFFYDYEPYHLTNVVAVGTAKHNSVTPAVPKIPGSFGGLAAVGFAFPNESKFIPLMSTFDKYGRDCGWAGGMLVNYGGAYRGSSWIFFGITNQEFYAAPAVLDTLTGAMKAARNGLAATAQAENEQAKKMEIKLTTPAPQGFIRRSPDGKHLVYPDGRRFFMSGCNYVGGFERCVKMWRDDFFSAAAVEEDFRKAQQAGLNSMRYWVSNFDKEIMRGDFRKVEVIKECARKYGVYLLLDLPGTGYATVEEMIASHKAFASAFKDEPMVIGYDLRNEPYVGSVAGIKYPAGMKPPVLTQNLAQKHPDLVSLKAIRETRAQHLPWMHLPATLSDTEADNTTAAILLWNKYMTKHDIQSTTLAGIVNCVPADPQYDDVVTAVDQSFGLWVRLQMEAIRSVDTNHLITVGYNTACGILPSNRQLDFVSHHVYARPYSIESVKENVTTLDRLAALWPDKPISFGEFGYSTGVPMANDYLDRYTASVGEMIHYLYAFSKNYDGVKKWMLIDWPRKIMQHYGDWNKGDATRIYEERFGLYYYDGTPEGRPKPIVPALHFFGEFIANQAPSGTLEIMPAPLSIGAGYVYKNKQALFVGNTAYASDSLTFTAARPANVMLRWDDAGLRLMASADAHVKIVPSAFGKFGKTVKGSYGSLQTEGDALILDLLEGETIEIH